MPDHLLTAAQGAELIRLLRALPTAIAEAIALRPPTFGIASKAIQLKDRRAMEALLPAIATRWQERTVFYSREVVDHIAAKPEVAAVVFGGQPLDANSARRLGKLFLRVEGVEVDGFVVRRGSEDTNGVFWSIERLSDPTDSP